MYAIVRTGGKQYRVAENQVVRVEKLDAGVGAEIRLEEVLMLGTDDGPTFGAPTVAGAAVVAKVVTHGKGRKIHGFTYKPKKNERRRFGHRQQFTELVVQSIEAPGAPRSRRRAARVEAEAEPAADETTAQAEASAESAAAGESGTSDRADLSESPATPGEEAPAAPSETAGETTEE